MQVIVLFGLHDNNGLDTLTKSLSQNGLGLDANTLNGVDDDKSTISDSQSSSDLRGEINVPGRVDQVDQEVLAVDLLADDVLEVLLIGESGVQGDGGRLDGDTTLLLVGSGVGGTSISSLSGGDDTSLSQEGVGQCRLAVILESGQLEGEAKAHRERELTTWAITL